MSTNGPRNATNLGDVLRQWREINGWELKELAFELAVPKATVVNWELGRREPAVRTLDLIRRLWALSWDEFLAELR